MQLNTERKCVKRVQPAESNFIRPYRIRRQQLLPIGSYRDRERTDENAVPGGFGWISRGRIYRERFKPGSRKFIPLSGTISLTYISDLASLAASSRLPNAKRRVIRSLFNQGDLDYLGLLGLTQDQQNTECLQIFTLSGRRFGSIDVRCKSPKYVILILLLVAILYNSQ